jgi:hypothetical protein
MALRNFSTHTRLLGLVGISLATLTLGSGCILVAEDDDAFCDEFDKTCDDGQGSGNTGGTTTDPVAGSGGEGGAGGSAGGGGEATTSSAGAGGSGGAGCDLPDPICAPGFECGGLNSCTDTCYGSECCELSCTCVNGTLSCDLVCN